MTDELPTMLTTAEVAERLRKSESTVRRMCASGELACVKIGRTWLISVDEVKRLLQPVRLAGGRELARERLSEVTHDEADEHPRRAASHAAATEGPRGDAPRLLTPRVIGM